MANIISKAPDIDRIPNKLQKDDSPTKSMNVWSKALNIELSQTLTAIKKGKKNEIG